jgi:hypothetical protein
MTRITIRNTAFAAAVLSLGFAVAGSTSAVAHEGHRPLAHQLAVSGYAGPAPSSARTTVQFVPGRGIWGESCDLPSSACSDNHRITN